MNKNEIDNETDIYWSKLFNRLERAIGWFFFITGLIILVSYSLYQLILILIKDVQLSLILKIGILLTIIGFVILIFSIIREKVVLSSKDKYKEVKE